ncbi:MAG TPA: hypothetical protein DEO92_08915, partial [Phycisphaerales bacterium]|nr:hypothetical protein [Phycisphaerales bacterium]
MKMAVRGFVGIGTAMTVVSLAVGEPTIFDDGSQLLFDPNGVRTDNFGFAVAMDANRIIVGEPGGVGANYDSGDAEIYVWNDAVGTGHWVLEETLGSLLTASQCPDGSLFGFAVDIDGDYAVVGAPITATGGDVFFFERDDFGWSYNGSTTLYSAGAQFGYAVDIEGLVVTIGAPGIENAGTYVIVPGVDGAVLGFVEELSPRRRGAASRFGHSVACDGNTVLIGAPLGDVGGVLCGTVSAYWRDSKTYSSTLEAVLEPDTDWAQSLARFGESVAVDGDIGAVGIMFPEAADPDGPAAAIFARSGIPGDGDWTLTATLQEDSSLPADRVGASIAIHSDLLVVGSPGSGPNGPNSGAAMVYRHSPSANQWVFEARLVGVDTGSSDSFGGDVAVSSRGISVGAEHQDEPGPPHNPNSSDETPDPGGVYVYGNADDGVWQDDIRGVYPCLPSIQTLENVGDASGADSFGSVVAIDNNTLFVGDPNGFDSDDVASGVVRLFTRTDVDSPWVADTTDALEAPAWATGGDRFGAGIAVNGQLAVIGAPGPDFGPGKTWIFQYSGGTWTPVQLLLGATDDQLGESVAIAWSGTNAYIAVGAPGALSDEAQGGIVYVYKWDGATEWATLLWTLTEDGFTSGTSAFGQAVDIEMRGDGAVVVAVGNPWYLSQAHGCVEIHSCWDLGSSPYSFLEERLVPSTENLDPWSIEWTAYVGSSVDLDGNRVIIGAPITWGVRDRQGAAFIYDSVEVSPSYWDWNLEGCLVSAEAEAYSYFGTSVALAGWRAFVGKTGSNYMAENGGVVEQYWRLGTDWVYA